MNIEVRGKAGASPGGSIDLQQKISRHRAHEHAHGESRDPEPRRQQRAAHNNRQVVDDGGK